MIPLLLIATVENYSSITFPTLLGKRTITSRFRRCNAGIVRDSSVQFKNIFQLKERNAPLSCDFITWDSVAICTGRKMLFCSVQVPNYVSAHVAASIFLLIKYGSGRRASQSYWYAPIRKLFGVLRAASAPRRLEERKHSRRKCETKIEITGFRLFSHHAVCSLSDLGTAS